MCKFLFHRVPDNLVLKSKACPLKVPLVTLTVEADLSHVLFDLLANSAYVTAKLLHELYGFLEADTLDTVQVVATRQNTSGQKQTLLLFNWLLSLGRGQ